MVFELGSHYLSLDVVHLDVGLLFKRADCYGEVTPIKLNSTRRLLARRERAQNLVLSFRALHRTRQADVYEVNFEVFQGACYYSAVRHVIILRQVVFNLNH